MNVLTSSEDVANAALAQIGYKLRIGNMFDGSDQSKIVLDIYGQTRDQLLRDFPWGFAMQQVVAIPEPSGLPFNWPFMYVYPSDCIKLRNLVNPTTFNANNPTPSIWEIATLSVGGSPMKVILSQVANATLIYTQQVTDPTKWDPGFTEAMIASLGRRLTVSLAPSPEISKLAAAAETAEIGTAENVLG